MPTYTYVHVLSCVFALQIDEGLAQGTLRHQYDANLPWKLKVGSVHAHLRCGGT